ncbi:MAG: TnsA endonuclease N-terminal domain-containing protein [Gammaproteobacteria bacterium]|nr:TnsA endonuclease N-terminal domain-containing protein [Gammaproteobacteria bacterium]
MAERKIPPNRRSLTGLLSVHPDQPQIPFESSLERDFVLLTEPDPRVATIEAQPVRIPYSDEKGIGRFYTPDYLVRFHPPEALGESIRPQLVEIKYTDDLKAKWEEFESRFRAAHRYAKARGWAFVIRTERRIRGPELQNRTFLKPYRASEVPFHDSRVVLDALFEMDKTSAQELVDKLSCDLARKAYLLHVVWHLVASGFIGVDLRQPLTMSSTLTNLEAPWESQGGEE